MIGEVFFCSLAVFFKGNFLSEKSTCAVTDATHSERCPGSIPDIERCSVHNRVYIKNQFQKFLDCCCVMITSNSTFKNSAAHSRNP